jgi:hypothetical protein
MAAQTTTADEYLASLPEARREAISAVREVLLKNLDPGYQEGIAYGMLAYSVPHSRYPAGYHCDPKQPLHFAALGSMKNYMALHLMCLYSGGDAEAPAAKLEQRFRAECAKAGKKLDMGKACIRFKKVEDLALEAITNVVKEVPVTRWIAINEAFLEARTRQKTARKAVI